MAVAAADREASSRRGGPFPRAILAATVVALAVRLALLFALGTFHVPAEDDHFAFAYENGRIARSIARGEGFVSPFGTGEPTAWMPPFYPFFLAGVFSIFGVYTDASALCVLLIQSAIGAATVPLLHALGRRAMGERAAVAASFAFALYPAAVYLSAGMVWPSALAVALVVSVLLVAELHAEREAAELALGAGLLTGLLGLVDPACLVVLPCLLAVIWRGSGAPRARLRSVLLAVAGCALFAVPWMVRNHLAFGEWVFLKSNFGNELWLGNNDHATGFWLDADGRYMMEHLPAEERESLDRMTEPALNRFYLARAVDWMKRNPVRVLELSLRRAGWFWWRVDFPAVRAKEQRAGGGAAFLVLKLSFRLAVLLGVAGLALSLLRRRPVLGPFLFCLLYPVSYYLTHVSNYRYRYPVEPLLLLFAAVLVERRPARRVASP